jgi:transposase InsO family protein
MTSLFALAAAVFASFFKGKRSLVLENLALRQQLAIYKRAQKHPPLRSTDRAFWIWFSKFWSGWRTPLLLVKPETVIRWHHQGFKLYWRWKSRPQKIGRPTIPREHIEFIRRMSADNPSWGEDKINEELRVKFGIRHSTSTIRKYMTKRSPHRDGQKWRTFIKNHSHELFACDFMTQHTALFTTVYVFVVMEISTRRIVHCNVTESPALDWLKIQIRDIAAFDRKPRFLLHDNDGIFGQFGRRKGGFRCHLDRWLSTTMDIEGLPTPYHAPNANPHVERFHRTLRQDALNHFIFLGASHVRRVAREFIEYYNRARPSQATHAIPDPYPELVNEPHSSGKLIALPVLGGVQHDYRLAA